MQTAAVQSGSDIRVTANNSGFQPHTRSFSSAEQKARELESRLYSGEAIVVALATLAQLAGPGTASCALKVSLSQRIGMRTSCLEKRITRA